MFVIFLLSSCIWKTQAPSTTKDGLVDYNTHDAFFMRIPKKWEVIEDTSTILPKPQTGSVELAVTSSIKQDNITNSLVILSEEVEKSRDSSEYMTSIFLKEKQLISSIKKIKEAPIVFEEGENMMSSKIFVFDAKYSKETPTLRYFQTAKICWTKGYVITLSLPTSVDDLLKYEYMLSQFRCK